MKRNTSVTLDENLDTFIKEQVESGAYTSASEVVRAALTRMADEEARKEQYVRNALNEALANPTTYSSEESWKRVDELIAQALKRDERGER